MPTPLSAAQWNAILVTERTMSVISLISTAIILSTFFSSRAFRKPINRILAYSSITNMVANIGSIISIKGVLGAEAAGGRTALCSFQATILQWCMLADPLWTMCMAINVWLTFFHEYQDADLRRLEKWYCLLCFGATGIPAIIILIVDHVRNSFIFGPAVIWCWITVDYDWMRLAFFYAPLWIAICATTFMHGTVLRHVFRHRTIMRGVSSGSASTPRVEKSGLDISPASNSKHFGRGFQLSTISRTDEMDITATVATPSDETLTPTGQAQMNVRTTTTVSAPPNIDIEKANQSPFFRPGMPARESTFAQSYTGNKTPKPKSPDAAWRYFKVAVLMFAALLIVWIPMTVNRAYTLAHPKNPSFGLTLAAAAVAPTQATWNCLVYIYTSHLLFTQLLRRGKSRLVALLPAHDSSSSNADTQELQHRSSSARPSQKSHAFRLQLPRKFSSPSPKKSNNTVVDRLNGQTPQTMASLGAPAPTRYTAHHAHHNSRDPFASDPDVKNSGVNVEEEEEKSESRRSRSADFGSEDDGDDDNNAGGGANGKMRAVRLQRQ